MLTQTFPKTIEISLQLTGHLPSIVADATQLHQVLLNLCVNARDAIVDFPAPSGHGTLTLRSGIVSRSVLRQRFANAMAEEYVFIKVQDSGIGMDEKTKSRIFEPFFTTKEIGKGTGLGLAVVYGVVNSHHGFVDVESSVGYGTTFSLYFPVERQDVSALQTSTETLAADSGGGNETILLVEDEEMLLDLLTNLLESKGYTVLTAKDGIEGYETYRTHEDKVALVLSDMGLPRLGGWDMILKMKEMNPNFCAILASGYFDPKLKTDMLDAGVKDFIQKPYIADEILKRIREALDKHGN
jgi:CheY-like chemotaxis protein